MRSLLMCAVLAGAPAFAADGEALLAAADLPMKAKEVRDNGLDADQVEAVLVAAKEAELTAAETGEMLAATAPLVKEHGPVENFGEMVKAKLEEGLRGEDLAAAIKEAHEGGKAAAADAKPAKPGPRPTKNTDNKPLVRPGLKRPGSGGGGKGGGGKKGGGKLTRPGGR